VLKQLYHHVKAIRSVPDQDQFHITIRWIPAHVDVTGNEYADERAKSAALMGTGDATEPVVWLAVAAKRVVRKRFGAEWAKQWDRERTSTPINRLVEAPGKKMLRLYDGLSKP
jgi:hypothetical protein